MITGESITKSHVDYMTLIKKVWVILLLLFFHNSALSQQKKEISGIIQYLSSPLLEGREIGTHGSKIAAEYIASQFIQSGLKPIKKSNVESPSISDYFQNFNLKRYRVKDCSLSVSDTQLTHGTDFIIENAVRNITIKDRPVWVGYGINDSATLIRSYNPIDVVGKVVIIKDGFPNISESWGKEWSIISQNKDSSYFELDNRAIRLAQEGATLLIVIPKDYPESFVSPVKPNMVGTCNNTELYQDAIFLKKGESHNEIPVVYLSMHGADKFYSTRHDSLLRVSFIIEQDSIQAYNVVSCLPGQDTNATVIIGAHYDHLGSRSEGIYTGADDNASGIAGLLILARHFANSGVTPEFNLVFAAWTGEEKGLLGSEHYASKLDTSKRIKLYLNMDMISRSAPEDIRLNIISIGTRKIDEGLRIKASEVNKDLNDYFQLDLWEVDGYHGSDYASFTSLNIPVATFFSGFHNDYHTPCDNFQRIDIHKADQIINFISKFLETVLLN
jgi:hypothetical protein